MNQPKKDGRLSPSKILKPSREAREEARKTIQKIPQDTTRKDGEDALRDISKCAG